MATAAVKRATVLIDGPRPEVTVQAGWRLRKSVLDYVEDATKGAKRGAQTRLVEEALLVHRDIFEALKEDRVALQLAAAELGIDYVAEPQKVIAKLVKLGLEAHAKSRKK